MRYVVKSASFGEAELMALGLLPATAQRQTTRLTPWEMYITLQYF